jgi:hypothetical protein
VRSSLIGCAKVSRVTRKGRSRSTVSTPQELPKLAAGKE